MNRKLIIVSNDGGTENFLPGVAKDVVNYEKFFRAPYGGAWEDKEIRKFHNISFAILKNYIEFNSLLEHVNYWLIVFCGHGYAKPCSYGCETIFELSKNEEISISQLQQITGKSACMLIADSCRKLFSTKSLQILNESYFSNTIPELNADVCRQTYNRALSVLPKAFYCGMSTSINETAGEDENIRGIYSHCLIKAVKESVKDMCANKKIIRSFFEVHKQASIETTKMRNFQNPCCSNNTAHIPFVVIG